jgi:hypothetical protein
METGTAEKDVFDLLEALKKIGKGVGRRLLMIRS